MMSYGDAPGRMNSLQIRMQLMSSAVKKVDLTFGQIAGAIRAKLAAGVSTWASRACTARYRARFTDMRSFYGAHPRGR